MDCSFSCRLFFTSAEETPTALDRLACPNMMVWPITLDGSARRGQLAAWSNTGNFKLAPAHISGSGCCSKMDIILIRAHHSFTPPMVRPDWKYLRAYRNNSIKGTEMITAVAAK